MTEDFYSRLGVAPDASEDAIRRAYRAKVAEQHPDVSDHPDAEARFRRLNRAKTVLTDEALRRQYDRLGHESFVQREESDEGPAEPPGRTSSERAGRTAETRPRPDGQWSTGKSRFDPESRIPRFETWIGRATARVDRRSDPSDPFAVDLTSFLRSSGAPSQPGSRRQSRAGEPSDHSERDCPTCGGRGSILHVIDTARGRRRRLEPCEECGGSGTV